MYKLCDHATCSGCGACASVCKLGAIKMILQEGFLYPQINENRCINCGKCTEICQRLGKDTIDLQISKAYAAFNPDDSLRMKASSGGVFGVLAKKWIDLGGIVCGAAWNESFNISHIIAEDEESLERLFTSKYVQSDTSDIYHRITDALEDGKKVLFSGTPCQCDGVRSVFGRRENLFLIDFVCYCVPSPEVFGRYLLSKQKVMGAAVRSYNFRNKRSGWTQKNFSTVIEYENGKEEQELTGHNPFYRAMCEGVITRTSCSNCRNKGVNRVTDITLGDFWGIQAVAPEMNDNKGTSLVLIHTNLGIELWDSVSSKMIVKEVEPYKALLLNDSFNNNVQQSSKRRDFFEKEVKTELGAEYLQLLSKSAHISILVKTKRKIMHFLKKLKVEKT